MEMIAMLGGLGQADATQPMDYDEQQRQAKLQQELAQLEAENKAFQKRMWKYVFTFAAGALVGYYAGRAAERGDF